MDTIAPAWLWAFFIASVLVALFVDFVEAGVTGGSDLEAIAHDYLEPLRLAGERCAAVDDRQRRCLEQTGQNKPNQPNHNQGNARR